MPVDAEMYPLIKYLIDCGLPLGGWNYRSDNDICFVSIMTDKYHGKFPSAQTIVATLNRIIGPDIIRVHEGYEKEGDPFNIGLIHVHIMNSEQTFISIDFHYTLVNFLNSALNLAPSYGTLLPGCKQLYNNNLINFEDLEKIRMAVSHSSVEPDEIYINNKKQNRKRKPDVLTSEM
jgi:hypothetical protein